MGHWQMAGLATGIAGKIPAPFRLNKQSTMISFAEAREIIAADDRRLPARTLPVDRALGAVAAAPVVSAIPVPGFANAAMDGYALRAAGTLGATPEHPLSLPVMGSIPAGGTLVRDSLIHSLALAGAGAVEIMTGAPLPPDCDAVVPLERVAVPLSAPGTILLHAPAITGQNVRTTGEDFAPGSLIVAAGTRLGPQHLMGLAACGVTMVPVRAAPRVAILTTGNELGRPGEALEPGQIHDANGPYLRAVLSRLGAEITSVATAPDEPQALRAQLLALQQQADLILTTGGVSAGRLDLLPGLIRDLGGTIGFHKVAIRPGKPLLYARLGADTTLFGLPGNPVAVAVGLRFFVIPALRALQGLPAEPLTPARVLAPVRGRGKLLFFAKARVAVDAAGGRTVEILPGQESFRIAPLMAANAWALVPGDTPEVPAGSLLLTQPLFPQD